MKQRMCALISGTALEKGAAEPAGAHIGKNPVHHARTDALTPQRRIYHDVFYRAEGDRRVALISESCDACDFIVQGGDDRPVPVGDRSSIGAALAHAFLEFLGQLS